MVSLYISVSPNTVHRPSAKSYLGYSVNRYIAELYPRPPESESSWVGFGNLHFYQMPQVILRHRKVQEQFLKIMQEDKDPL